MDLKLIEELEYHRAKLRDLIPKAVGQNMVLGGLITSAVILLREAINYANGNSKKEKHVNEG